MNGLAQLIRAEAIQGLGGHAATVLPDPVFIKQRTQERVRRLPFQGQEQQQFTLQESYMTETGERIRAVRYTADFSYKFGGKLVVEDVKSTPTRTKEYLRNRKFMRSKFGIDIQEI